MSAAIEIGRLNFASTHPAVSGAAALADTVNPADPGSIRTRIGLALFRTMPKGNANLCVFRICRTGGPCGGNQDECAEFGIHGVLKCNRSLSSQQCLQFGGSAPRSQADWVLPASRYFIVPAST